MKQSLVRFIVAVFVFGLAGCEQAQQAIDTIGKAKSFKDDVGKKAKEVKDSALGLIPGNNRESSKDQGDGDGEGDE